MSPRPPRSSIPDAVGWQNGAVFAIDCPPAPCATRMASSRVGRTPSARSALFRTRVSFHIIQNPRPADRGDFIAGKLIEFSSRPQMFLAKILYHGVFRFAG